MAHYISSCRRKVCLLLVAFPETNLLLIFVQNLPTGFILFCISSPHPHPFRPEIQNIGSSLVLVKFPPYTMVSSLIPITEAVEVHAYWLFVSHSEGVLCCVPDIQRAPEITEINRAQPFSCFHFFLGQLLTSSGLHVKGNFIYLTDSLKYSLKSSSFSTHFPCVDRIPCFSSFFS